MKEWIGKRKRRFFVLRQLTKREKKHANSETKLGHLWVVVDPLLHMAIFSFLATSWFKHDLENFPMYVLTGYIIYNFYHNATSGAISSLVSNKNFLVQTRWKKEIFVQQRIYSAFLDFLSSCVPYVLFLMIFRIKPGWKCLFIIPDMLLMVLLVSGVGRLLAAAYVFFADIRYFYENFMTLLMFASGLFYPIDILPAQAAFIPKWNPVYLCIEIARNSLMYAEYSDLFTWFKLALWAFAMYAAGVRVFSKKENAMMQKL